MTLIIKSKSGKVKTFENVDDVDLNLVDNSIYVYFNDGSASRCNAHAVHYYIEQHDDGTENTIFPLDEYHRLLY